MVCRRKEHSRNVQGNSQSVEPGKRNLTQNAAAVQNSVSSIFTLFKTAITSVWNFTKHSVNYIKEGIVSLFRFSPRT